MQTPIPAFEAPKMIEIEDRLVVEAEIQSDNLILTQKDGTVFDAGNVRGLQGRAPGDVMTIQNDVDMDDLTTIGWYEIAKIASLDTMFAYHYPAPGAGLVHVVSNPDGSMVWQTYTIYRGGSFVGSVWTRTLYNGVWTEWHGVGGSDWQPLPGLDIYDYFEPYGGGYAQPEFRIFGDNVYLRGLLRCINWFGTQNGEVFAHTPSDAIPTEVNIYSVAMGPQILVELTSPVQALHYHVINRENGRLNVMPSGNTGVISVVTNFANDYYNIKFNEGNYLSLSRVSYQWR